jgi:putative transposase
LDEVFITIGGTTCYLWRAVDADGMVLHILVLERRNQQAAETFLRGLVEGYPELPRATLTDTRGSYAPAIKTMFPQTEHRQHKGLNNRAHNSHQPTTTRRPPTSPFLGH